MKKRTKARELALKALYQCDVMSHGDADTAEKFCRSHAHEEPLEFAVSLARGCMSYQGELDELISKTSENWDLPRMPVIDRNILRLGTHELLHCSDTPPRVAMNEAIELAKVYGTQSSAQFVNGVLDRIYTLLRERSSDDEGAESSTRSEEAPTKDDAEIKADLHLHSTASDGSVKPADLPELARRRGVDIIALSDHDSLQGVEAAQEAARKIDMELIAGVELTAYAPAEESDSDVEIHVLGLFVDPEAEELTNELQKLREIRVERVREITRKLQNEGCDVEAQDILDRAVDGSVGRAHVAEELVSLGICDNLREVFNKYIGIDKPAYVPKKEFTPAQAMELIHKAGGVSVFAHPGVGRESPRLIREMAAEGLDGIEVHYPTHSARQEKQFMELAEELDLAVSGGSDFHGESKPEIDIGEETVSMVEVRDLRNRCRITTS